MRACSSVSSKAVSLPSLLSRLYLGALLLDALSHFLTVLRDSTVSFAMALVENLSRSFMRLTLPNMSMVITFFSC
ncbi:hypothetical protein POHY109586_24520 [Polaromonas hydrogenivorans]